MKLILQKGSSITLFISSVFFIGTIFFFISSFILSSYFFIATIIIFVLGISVANMSLPMIVSNNEMYIPKSLFNGEKSNPIIDVYWKRNYHKIRIMEDKIIITYDSKEIEIDNSFNNERLEKVFGMVKNY